MLFSDKIVCNGMLLVVFVVIVLVKLDVIEFMFLNFDVLCVEKDGLIVIVGGVLFKVKVEVFDGDKVIGLVVVGLSGDFVIVFDKLLELGDYLLVLKVIGVDGKVVIFVEIVIVLVLNGKDGKLFVMVIKLGEVSCILIKLEGVM